MSEMKSNGFEVTLREMRGGRSLNELSEKLAELVAAVKQTGKAGSITYKLKVKPASAGDLVTLQLEDDLKPKIPELARGASIFFADDANVLQRTDPRQKEFTLTTVPSVAPEPLVKVG
jgi:hypothetical protein